MEAVALVVTTVALQCQDSDTLIARTEALTVRAAELSLSVQ